MQTHSIRERLEDKSANLIMNRKELKAIGLLALVIFLLTACNIGGVRGSGDLISESRDVSNFDRVNLSGMGEVIIIQSGEESLVVETDDNIMEYVTTKVRGRTLELGFESTGITGIRPTELTFTLHVKELAGLDVSGSGGMTAENIEADELDVAVSGSGSIRIDSFMAEAIAVHLSGSGEVEMTGEAAKQTVDIGGSGEYSAGDLYSNIAEVDISGSGKATVWVDKSLDARLSGSGSVNYYGNPTVDSASAGSATIESLGEK